MTPFKLWEDVGSLEDKNVGKRRFSVLLMGVSKMTVLLLLTRTILPTAAPKGAWV